MEGHIAEMALVQTTPNSGNNGLRSVINSLQLSPMTGWGGYTDIDFGTPEIDAIVTPYSDRSGTFNETQFHRASAVSISMALVDDWFPSVGAELWPREFNKSSYWIQRLGYWTSSRTRSMLYWRYKDRTEAYWMPLVGSGMSNSIGISDRGVRYTQLNFTNPDGQIYKFDNTYDLTGDQSLALKDGRSRTLVYYGGSQVGGFTLPITFPFGFTSGGVAGSVDPALINYQGTVENGFIARIYSGTTAPTYNARLNVTHVDTGEVQSIGFQAATSGPTSAANIPTRTVGSTAQFVEIDTNKRSALMNADPNSRQNGYLSTPLNWPVLRPGANRLAFTVNGQPDGSASPTPGTGSYIEVTWYEAYLT